MVYTFLDFETTGLDLEKDQITEVGIIKTDFENIYEELNFFVRLEDGRILTDFIKNLTGITEKHLLDGKPISDSKSIIKDFIKDTILVAQFASFDIGFIKEIEIPQFYCTRTLSCVVYPNENHSLGPMCTKLGIKTEVAHRALSDCEMTKRLFKFYLDLLGENEINKYINVIAQTKKRPLRYIPKNAKIIDL